MSSAVEPMHNLAVSDVSSQLSYESEFRDYLVCGLRIRSSVSFPLVSLPSRSTSVPDVEFLLKPAGLSAESFGQIESVLGTIRNGAGVPSITASQTPQCYRLDCSNGPKQAVFLVSLDGRRIECYPAEGMTRQDVERWLFGLVLAFVLQKRGIFSLHGAAVQCSGRGIAFLGNNGFGKSTLAFFFLRRGHQLVTDDVLALAEEEANFKILPACPSMNLWPNTVSELGDEHLRIPAGEGKERKSRLSLRDMDSVFCSSDVPLERLYLLNPTKLGVDRGVRISRVPASAALLELFRHTRAGSVLSVAEQKSLLETFARLISVVPVCRLQYPAGFEQLPGIYTSILDDLSGT